MNHVKEILTGLAIFIAVVGIITLVLWMLYSAGQNNRQKVENMTNLCVAQGHTGWSNYVGCFGGTVGQR